MHFQGILRGKGKRVERVGSASSGIEATVAGHGSGSVTVRAFLNEEKDETWVFVRMERWGGQGVSKLLYRGPIDRYEPEQVRRG